MDYDKVIKQIISEFNLDKDVQKQKAYRECIEYADKNLDGTSEYNPFLQRAADILGQVQVRKDMARHAIELLGEEKLHLTYSKTSGPVLTGNASGLSYLSEVIREISETAISGEHSHFYYNEPPLYGNSYPLTIYIEDDNWFAEHAKVDKRKEKSDELKYRDINVDEIIAFMITDDTPPPFLMRACKIYKVMSCEKYDSQNIWIKEIREQTDRVFVFEFKQEDGQLQKLGLNLDDDTVFFLTKDELNQFV
jgi:hypothetical protein